MPAAARQFALDVVTTLRRHGFQALWAGGCVRDQLLGIAPKDYDVATDARPDEIRQVFGRRRTLAIGESFGVITVLGPKSAGQIEVATFRTDATYSDGRHPDAVTFTTAEHDAQRRDFTINGLFFDPVADEVIDYVGGQDDLRARLVRAIGDPNARLAEDKLRMLRAVRFAATFEFEIEAGTLAAIKTTAHDITQVSAERIGAEVARMLVDRLRARAVRLLEQTGLLQAVLPEVASQPLDESLQALDALAEPTLATALASLLTTRSAETCRKVARRLRLTNKVGERAGWLVETLPVVRQAEAIAWPVLQRILVHDGAAELLALASATLGADHAAVCYCQQKLAQPPDVLNPPPLLCGNDLIAHGLTPGAQFTMLLERVRDAQLEGTIRSRDDALAWVDRLRAEADGG